MEYIGKLYGRLGRDFYFDTGKTTEDYDRLELDEKRKVYEFASWLQQQNFTNPDMSVSDWVNKYFNEIKAGKL